MASEWHSYAVQDLIDRQKLVIGDGYRAKNQELSREGLPFARAGNINEGFHFADADHFPLQNLAKVGNKLSRAGDVVFTSKGTVGRFAFVRPEAQQFVYSPQLCFWRSLDKDFIDPHYLYFWMFGREFYVQFKGVAGQTDMAEYVSLTDQRRMHITLPKIDEQRDIARILGSMDDKIELNRKMNETLEAMARAFFQSWFVDFDPVRAKAEGRPTGLPAPIAALFPDSFEDSELGRMPKGWKAMRVEDVSERLAMGPFGSSIKVETFVDSGVPIISGQHLRGFMLEDSTFNFITEEHARRLSKAEVRRGDVIFTHAGSIGQAAFVPEESQFERYIISQRQFFLRCNRAFVTPSFMALYFGTDEGRHKLLANTSSSGVPSIARPVSYLRSIVIPVPPRAILTEFERFVAPILSKYRKNQDNGAFCGRMRDLLLPKLISGEVRIQQLETCGEERV